MPRQYADCKPGSRRYIITTEDAFGRALGMCRQLDADDDQVKVGRRTRCFHPDRPAGNRKTCRTLVSREFKTLVSPSYYFPTELQRRGVGYECHNQNEIMLSDFAGQGEGYAAEFQTDHLIVGPVKADGSWIVRCSDPQSLLPGDAPPPPSGSTFSARHTRRAAQIVGYVPTRDECTHILERMTDEWNKLCRDSRENMELVTGFVRGLLVHHYCSDDLFSPVQDIVDGLDGREKRVAFMEFTRHLFLMGMYQRRWTGEGSYPFEENQTRRLVTPQTVARSLRGKTDPETQASLDYVSSNSNDGAEGVLVNCVRLHARKVMNYFEDDWLSPEGMDALRAVQPASIHLRALLPRHVKPTRFVNSLLPLDNNDTLINLIDDCVNGRLCLRMGSARLVLTAVMLYYAAFNTRGTRVPWSDADIFESLELLDNIV